MEALRFMEISPLIVGFTRQIAYGVVLIAFMCFRPQGFVGEFAARPKREERKPSPLRGDGDRSLLQGGSGKLAGLLRQEARQESSEVLLRLDGVSKNFGGLKAVNHCTLDLKDGEIVGLIGPNGAGKTTLFNVITGFYPTETGAVHFSGQDISRLSPHRITHLGIARSFQDVRLFHNMTVLDNVLVAQPKQTGESLLGFSPIRQSLARRKKTGKAMAYLEFVGLAGKRRNLREARRAETLSLAGSSRRLG
jgi:ABC-type multidrug transport system fused ATPase/permease subunit